jgi:stress-induced-phosphoprotein 1
MDERAKRAMNDPKVQEILSDPVMRQILEQMSTDPAAARDHMKNPMIREKIQVLAAAGVIGLR